MDIPLRFGAELRRLRESSGMTIQQLADVVSYSRGHLSKIERGVNPPTRDLAQRCDSYFEADGRLRRAFMAEMESRGKRRKPARRQVITTGIGSLIATRLVEGSRAVHVGGDELPPGALFREQLRQMKQLGQSLPPTVMLPVLRSQASNVLTLASHTTGTSRAELLVTASRFAVHIGWVAQEGGDDTAALDATAEAVELARAGGDEHLADYALVRRALVAYYSGHATRTIALAQQAQRSAAPPRIRGLAAQREAQGYALAGDEGACLQALDRARDLLAVKEEVPDGTALGTTQLTDSVSMVTGWCMYDLGRPRQAAAALERECRRIAPHALNTRMRYGLRHALALAASGEGERSCETARELLGFMGTNPSATVRTDVRRLDREWSRFRGNAVVRGLRPALANVLNAGI
ncbi:Helix-turn-helix domain-containing protein [Streptomyces sp. BpilaLS-43]|uniref:helix-turn-helix domain-containing protein n=1 Tax=Streptomyces sp. BpilaLS-43 TaxID=1839778 RepID=UPI00081B575B|nr:helix-turn-helix transcriptional regulator [Streptomyces sp. BpilaLS-43]SCD64054.1 Helix-turn-helix domain-containing protein [Streptomyces sp. BpilaLS-43]